MDSKPGPAGDWTEGSPEVSLAEFLRAREAVHKIAFGPHVFGTLPSPEEVAAHERQAVDAAPGLGDFLVRLAGELDGYQARLVQLGGLLVGEPPSLVLLRKMAHAWTGRTRRVCGECGSADLQRNTHEWEPFERSYYCDRCDRSNVEVELTAEQWRMVQELAAGLDSSKGLEARTREAALFIGRTRT